MLATARLTEWLALNPLPATLVPSLVTDALADRVFSTTTGDVGGTSGIHLPFFLLKNPVNSGKILRVTSLLLSTCISTNNNIFKGYMSAVVTADGTPLSVVGSKTPTAVATAQAFLKPTLSAQSNSNFTACVGPTSAFSIPGPLIILPGNLYLVTCRNNTTGVTASVTANWVEELV